MPIDITAIEEKIEGYKAQGLALFASSSFQSHSIPMLHIISRIDPEIPVYFLNTGYHFPETIAYKEKITRLLGIKVIDLKPSVPKNLQKDGNGQLYFTSDPDMCCYLNKIQPMEPVLGEKDVWITGVRRDQSARRQSIDYEENAPQNTIRYHPMLDITKKQVTDYLKTYDLPRHPLEAKGFVSVGCEPCTQKVDFEKLGNEERDGRWAGLNKTECGLHTELIQSTS